MKARSKSLILIALVLSFGVSGCALMDASGEPENNEGEISDAETLDAQDAHSPDAGGVEDAETSDTEDAQTGDAEDAQTGDACVPLTVEDCHVDQNGEIDDNCGGVIQCPSGDPCIDGELQQGHQGCGVCGLGQRVCGSDETGDGTCEFIDDSILPETDDVDCDNRLIFVDAETDEAENNRDGSRDHPYKRYADALLSAGASEDKIIILGNEGIYQETLRISNGISVWGGFDPDNGFRWEAGSRSKFEVPATEDEDIFGLKAKNITSPTQIGHLNIKTSDVVMNHHGQSDSTIAAKLGRNNYGAYIHNSNHLTLRALTVQTGAAGDGANGANGQPGQEGSGGQNASNSTNANPIARDNNSTVLFKAALGGLNYSCAIADGGKGGLGLATVDGQRTDPKAGVKAVSGATGGNPGEGSSTNVAPSAIGPGQRGSNGDSVSDGTNGQGASDHGSLDLTTGHWEPSAGTDGVPGPHGNGGGGGGGADVDNTNKTTQLAAAPGGGGGAGGCGGGKGRGGASGGGSFGLMLINSNATLINTEFKAGDGGDGGDGGNGGDGGDGGSGGAHSNHIGELTEVNGVMKVVRVEGTYDSGEGGDGSDGGGGGDGGGGAGGVSYGLFCAGSSTITEITNVSFSASNEAAPAGDAPNPGVPGIHENRVNCPSL